MRCQSADSCVHAQLCKRRQRMRIRLQQTHQLQGSQEASRHLGWVKNNKLLLMLPRRFLPTAKSICIGSDGR